MPAIPPVSHVLETSLYVSDLDRAQRFYQDVFGFELFIRDSRMCGLGVPGRQVLLLFRHGGSIEPGCTPGGTIPPHDASGALHLCFAIAWGELAAWKQHLAAAGIPVESRVVWAGGGESLYFRDPDGHSLEVATPGLWPTY